ncbi:MAG: hypothetical protein M1514_01330, partial [Patescibacteria group bacterium]|nr:hypothetical protein [Patescibacteria group bacterium]
RHNCNGLPVFLTESERAEKEEFMSHIYYQSEGNNLHVKLEPPLVSEDQPFEITYPARIVYQGRFFDRRQANQAAS